MEIIRTNIDTQNKKEVYHMIKSNAINMQTLEKGLSLPVDKYCVYVESKIDSKTGESVDSTVCSIISEGIKYATISQTFIREFMDILDVMENDPFSIIITGGTSRGGRKFVSCELDCTK